MKPVFLPFMHRSMRHLSRTREPRPWLTVGQVLDASSARAPEGRRRPPRGPDAQSARRVPLQDEGSDVMELSEQGFYELRGRTTRTPWSWRPTSTPAEADLTPMDPKEIVAIATGGPGERRAAAGPGVPLTPEAQEKNQRLWWYLLIAGSLLLGAETVLSNRMAKA